ncbi:protein PAXX [Spea bombifrons]|uniref:protein PAXX n=1 Tax=Spea bombifrons TaxID=233779 RepID=UPI0023493CBB|nr:protein PAXX [Spea bombifrons]
MDARVQAFVSLCSLSHKGQRYLCHGGVRDLRSGGLEITVTNGIEVWRSELSKETLEEWETSGSFGSPEDSAGALRRIFERVTPVLDVNGSLATLSLSLHSGNVTLELFKLSISETRMHLQTLLFDLADRVQDLEKCQRGGSESAAPSPVKAASLNNLMPIPDIEARRRGHGTSITNIKKRLPGESLVNPGCKRKKPATGVDFEES